MSKKTEPKCERLTPLPLSLWDHCLTVHIENYNNNNNNNNNNNSGLHGESGAGKIWTKKKKTAVHLSYLN